MQLLTDLNIDLVALLVNIVGFLLLLWVLNILFFKPINLQLTERQQDITSTYDQLEADRRQMETLRTDYEQRLAGIEAEAREKIQSAIKDAQSARDQIVQEAQGRARELQVRAEQDIEREREQALITLRQQVVDLALGATTKIIGDSLDEARQRRLIDDFITSSVSGNGTVGSGTNGAAGGAAAYSSPSTNPAQA